MNLKGIGGLLFLLGVGSIVLNLVGFEFKLLMWIDNWGTQVGWAIRGGMIVVGGALWLLIKAPAQEAATEAPPAQG
jgi:hypothetical protein